jgi:phage repressor protein C with HTH and peptisase S24 domain
VDIYWLITGKTEFTPAELSVNQSKTDKKGGVPPAGNGLKASPTPSPAPSPTPENDYKLEKKEGYLSSEKLPIYGVTAPSIVTINEHGIDNILYVPIRAQAGYLVGYSDPDFIETLPTFRMPGLTNRSYRMFEVKGLSMSPNLSNGDRVIGEWVPNLNEIRQNRVHVIVHKGGVVVKRLLNRVEERGKLYIKSDTITHRQDFPTEEIDPAEILEIWYVRLKISGDLSEPSEVYHRLADLELNQLEIMKKLGLAKG